MFVFGKESMLEIIGNVFGKLREKLRGNDIFPGEPLYPFGLLPFPPRPRGHLDSAGRANGTIPGRFVHLFFRRNRLWRVGYTETADRQTVIDLPAYK